MARLLLMSVIFVETHAEIRRDNSSISRRDLSERERECETRARDYIKFALLLRGFRGFAFFFFRTGYPRLIFSREE